MPTKDDKSKSVFPKWLKRLNPALEAENTNVIYQAFRDHRRRKHSRFRAEVCKKAAYSAALAILVLFFLYEAMRRQSLFIVQQDALAAILITVISIFAAIGALWYRKTMSAWPARLPPYSFLLLDHPGFRAAAADVWMTGAGGREIAEANYLEYYEILMSRPWLLWAVPQIPLLFFCALLHQAYPFNEPSSLPVSLSCAALSPIIFFFSYQMAHSSAVETFHLRLIHRRIQALGAGRKVREQSKFAARILLLAFLPAIIGGLFYFLFPMGKGIFRNLTLDLEAIRALGLKIAPIIPIVWASILAARWRLNFRRDAQRVRAILDASEIPNELYLSVVIFGADDPDSRKWAEDRWGKDFPIPNFPPPKKFFGIF